MRSGVYEFSDCRNWDQQELGFWFGGFGENGIELGLLIGREQRAGGNCVDSAQTHVADGREIARGRNNFIGKKRFLRQGGECRVVLAPERELAAQFVCSCGVAACAGQEFVHKL